MEQLEMDQEVLIHENSDVSSKDDEEIDFG